MDTPNDQIVRELTAVFEKIFIAGNFSAEQKKRLFSSLEEATMLHAISTLLQKVTPEEKAKSMEQKFESQEALLSHLGGFVTGEQFAEVLASSIEKVVNAFFSGLLSKTVHQS